MKNFFITVVVLAAIVAISWAIIDKETHEWHPIGPNVKFGTLLEVKGEDDGPLLAQTNFPVFPVEPKSYVKKTFTWSSNKVDKDTITWQFIEGGTSTDFTVSLTDFGPDANAWVRFDWCSRHGEVRAVRVE